jgi:hypothetical protein
LANSPAHRAVEIPRGFIGNMTILKSASGRIFLTSFKREDVEFFIEAFEDLKSTTRLSPDGMNILEQTLTGIINDWIGFDATVRRCPFEPFLYALKAVNGVIFTLKDTPNEMLVKAYARVLESYWEAGSDEHTQIVKNILSNWDWGQPVFVAIGMYACHTQDNDPEIDEIMLKRLLYTRLYAEAAYVCLANRPGGINSARALIDYIREDSHPALNTKTPIEVTNSMKRELKGYLKNIDPDIYRELAEEYTETIKHKSISKNGRKCLDSIFKVRKPQPSSFNDILKEYPSIPADEKETFAVRLRLAYSESRREDNDALTRIDDPELLETVIGIVEDSSKNSGSMIFALMSFAKSKFEPARDYITQKYAGLDIKNPRWLEYACAASMAGDSVALDYIFEQFFFKGASTAEQNRGFVMRCFLRENKNDAGPAMKKLFDKVIHSPEMQPPFLIACLELFKNRDFSEKFYPEVFDGVWRDMTAKALMRKPPDTRTLSYIVDLVSYVANNSNKSSYEKMLTEISITKDEKSYKLPEILKRVDSLMLNLYKS